MQVQHVCGAVLVWLLVAGLRATARGQLRCGNGSEPRPLCELLTVHFHTDCVVAVDSHLFDDTVLDSIVAAVMGCGLKIGHRAAADGASDAQSRCSWLYLGNASQKALGRDLFACSESSTAHNSSSSERPVYLTEPAEAELVQHNGFLRFRRTKRFRVAVVEVQPWTMKISDRSANGSDAATYTGPLMQVLNALAENLNFQYELVEPADNMFGIRLENGTWSGMMGQVIAKQVDFAASEVTVTEERAKHVDFTTSFWGEDITFMVKVSNENKLFIYSRLFDANTWTWLLCSIVVSSVFLVSVSGNLNCRKQGVPSSVHFAASQLLTTLGYAFNQGTHDPPAETPRRLFLSCFWLMSVSLAAVFSGNLMAFTAVKKQTLPISSFEELAAHPEYQAGVPANGSTSVWFKNSRVKLVATIQKNNIGVNKENYISYDNIYSPKYRPDVVARLRKEKFVYIGERTMLSYYLEDSNICDLTLSASTFAVDDFAFPAYKGFPFVDAFNQRIAAMQEAGLIDQWLKMYFPAEKNNCEKLKSSLGEARAALEDTTGAYVVLAAGVGAAGLVLGAELAWNTARTLRKAFVKPKLQHTEVRAQL